MFASASSTSAAAPASATVPRYLRSRGEVGARFIRAGGVTRLQDLYETGGLRLKLPNAGAACEGVIINTAGGLTGGDESRFTCDLGPGARVRIATQSAEKVYRAEAGPAQVAVALHLDKRSALAWLPQETILFDGAGFVRTLDVDMAESATLTLLEIAVFGRTARGERVTAGRFHDRWRVRRGGELIFAESVRLDGDIAALLDIPAVGSGACAIATLLHVAPNAETKLKTVRTALARAGTDCGASAWNGMLVARFCGGNSLSLRRDAALALARVLPGGLPRIWAF